MRLYWLFAIVGLLTITMPMKSPPKNHTVFPNLNLPNMICYMQLVLLLYVSLVTLVSDVELYAENQLRVLD